MLTQEKLLSIASQLRAGKSVQLATDDFPCFGQKPALIDPRRHAFTLARISSRLSAQDACVFERAAQAMAEGDLAWIGFKIVADADQAVSNTDNEVTKRYGAQGSADGQDLVFFCNDTKEIVAGRQWSPRDTFQMKDVTRGPAMHTDQFPGLTWASVPLFDQVRVWLVGASDCAVETAALAHHVGFKVDVVDIDPEFANTARFPQATVHLLDSFDDLGSLVADPKDYVCVLTRGHLADPEGCAWAVANEVHYVGMMGCKGKNTRVEELCAARGVTPEQWARIKRPIGLKFGAKTVAELAIAIVAELVDVRYQQRYSQEARDKHEASLGR